MEWLEAAGQMSVVAGAIGGAFIYVITNVVLNPLRTTIRRLEATIERFSDQLARADQRWHDHDVALVRIDQKVEALHERLDRIELKTSTGRDNHEERHEHR